MPTRQKNDPLIKSLRQPLDEIRRLPEAAPTRHRAGMLCPYCGSARLDYNSLLQLACPGCGVIEIGGFT